MTPHPRVPANEDELRDTRDQHYWADRAIVDEYLPTIGLHAFAVYTLLTRYANDRGTCFPAIGTLAEKLGISKPTVRKAIEDLTSAKLISVTPRFITGQPKTHDTNLYTLLRVKSRGVVHEVNQGVVKDVDQGGGKGDLPGVVNLVDPKYCTKSHKEETNRYSYEYLFPQVPLLTAHSVVSAIPEVSVSSPLRSTRSVGPAPLPNARLEDTGTVKIPVAPKGEVKVLPLVAPKKHRAKDWIYELLMLRSHKVNPKDKAKRKLYNGRVVRDRANLVGAVFSGRKPTLDEVKAFERELRAAYKWHAQIRDAQGQRLEACQSGLSLFKMVERYRKHRAEKVSAYRPVDTRNPLADVPLPPPEEDPRIVAARLYRESTKKVPLESIPF